MSHPANCLAITVDVASGGGCGRLAIDERVINERGVSIRFELGTGIDGSLVDVVLNAKHDCNRDVGSVKKVL